MNIKPNINNNTKCVLLQGLRVNNAVVVCIVSQEDPTVPTVVLEENYGIIPQLPQGLLDPTGMGTLEY